MKKFSTAKILSLVFVCVMLLGALALTAFATEGENLDIVMANVNYGDTFQIMFAVDAPEGATVKATDSEGNEIEVAPFQADEIPYQAYILTEGVSAQAIDEVITLSVEYNGKTVSKNYSVLRYIYQRSAVLKDKADAATEIELAELDMLNALLDYAIKANAFFKGATENTFDKYRLVSASGVTVNGIAPSGMYAPGVAPFANIDAIDYDAENYDLSVMINGESSTLDALKALTVGTEDITVTVEVVEKEVIVPGTTVENPILVFTVGMNDTVKVPANTTYYFEAYNIAGMVLTANGEAIEFVAGIGRQPSTFTITNDTDAEVEYALSVSYPVGSMDNPAELVIGENTATVSAGSQGYFYTFIAEKTGKLTITLTTETAWSYTVNNLTAGKYGDIQLSDAEGVANPFTVDVTAGDEIQIVVNTYNPADMWGNPEGTISVAAAFEEVHLDSDGDFVCDDEGCGVTVLPAADSVLTIEQALKLGVVAGDQYTADKYYVTGIINNVYNTTYGNMYIEDENGNELLVYGTYSKDGSTRYDALATKPVVGDTVTLYGVLGTYSGTAQMMSGWIYDHTAHTHVPNGEATCENSSSCIICEAILAEKLDHTYVDGVCSGCGEEEPTEGTNRADLDTITGTSTSYITSTTTSGWTATNAAVFKGGTTNSSPAFVLIGDASNRGVALNGKTSAVGKLTSATLTGGISKLTFTYGNVFSEANGVDITINIKQNDEVVATKQLDNNSVTQYTAYTFEWVLDTAIEGEFVIEIVNNCPSNNSNKNKDRVVICDIEWTSAPAN